MKEILFIATEAGAILDNEEGRKTVEELNKEIDGMNFDKINLHITDFLSSLREKIKLEEECLEFNEKYSPSKFGPLTVRDIKGEISEMKGEEERLMGIYSTILGKGQLSSEQISKVLKLITLKEEFNYGPGATKRMATEIFLRRELEKAEKQEATESPKLINDNIKKEFGGLLSQFTRDGVMSGLHSFPLNELPANLQEEAVKTLKEIFLEYIKDPRIQGDKAKEYEVKIKELRSLYFKN
jgi:hypothetical protein